VKQCTICCERSSLATRKAGEGMSLKSIKRKIIKFLLATVWTTGAVAVIKLEAEQPVHNREFFDDTRTTASSSTTRVPSGLRWLSSTRSHGWRCWSTPLETCGRRFSKTSSTTCETSGDNPDHVHRPHTSAVSSRPRVNDVGPAAFPLNRPILQRIAPYCRILV